MGGYPVIVGLCVNLDAASLLALIVVFNSSYPLFSMFLAVNDSVCIVIVSLVPLASFRAMRMSVISASRTNAESLSLIMISSTLSATAADTTRVPSLEPSI